MRTTITMTAKHKRRKIIHRRPGGGRKPFYGENMVRIFARITPTQLDYLTKRYNNISAGIRDLIDRNIFNT